MTAPALAGRTAEPLLVECPNCRNTGGVPEDTDDIHPRTVDCPTCKLARIVAKALRDFDRDKVIRLGAIVTCAVLSEGLDYTTREIDCAIRDALYPDFITPKAQTKVAA